MELNWTTFLLEVINFLVLVWLLKRFLYRPVLDMIERRRQKIEAELSRAASVQKEADALKEQYAERLTQWEKEKQLARESLEQAILQERERRLKLLDEEFAKQRQQQQARNQQEQDRLRARAESEAIQQGGAFAARLLAGLAGPELDLRLQQLFVAQLASLPDKSRDELAQGWHDGSSEVEVVSATSLDASRQEALRMALEEAFGPNGQQWRFSQDSSLIAGLRVSCGGWMLEANLKDELRFFGEAASG